MVEEENRMGYQLCRIGFCFHLRIAIESNLPAAELDG